MLDSRCPSSPACDLDPDRIGHPRPLATTSGSADSALARLERVARCEAPRSVAEPPFTGGVQAHPTGDRLPWDAVVLDQAGELHACVEERCDGLAQAVVPLRGDIEENCTSVST